MRFEPTRAAALLLLAGAGLVACSEVRWPVLDAQREEDAAKVAVVALRSIVPPPPPIGGVAGPVPDQAEGLAFQLRVSADRVLPCPGRALGLAAPSGGLTHVHISFWRVVSGAPSRVPDDSWLASALRRSEENLVTVLCWSAGRRGVEIENARGSFSVLLDTTEAGVIKPLDFEQTEVR